MGTIRARVSDELEEKIQNIIDEVQKEAVGGVEINMSTVIRYALDNYIKEYEERKNEVITLKFNLSNISDYKLNKLEEISSELSKLFSCGWEEEIPLVKSTFMLNEAVKYELYKRKKSSEELELTEEEKKFLKKEN